MVAMTGTVVSGSNSDDERCLDAGDIPGVLDDHALQSQAQTQGRDLVGAGLFDTPSLPSMPRMPKPPGTQIASSPASAFSAPASVSQSSEAIQRILTFASLAKPP